LRDLDFCFGAGKIQHKCANCGAPSNDASSKLKARVIYGLLISQEVLLAISSENAFLHTMFSASRGNLTGTVPHFPASPCASMITQIESSTCFSPHFRLTRARDAELRTLKTDFTGFNPVSHAGQRHSVAPNFHLKNVSGADQVRYVGKKGEGGVRSAATGERVRPQKQEESQCGFQKKVKPRNSAHKQEQPCVW
jgi:hypothetical protein